MSDWHPDTPPELEELYKSQHLPAEEVPLGKPDLDFIASLKIHWILNKHGNTWGYSTSREAVRQMRNLIHWKKTLPAGEFKGRSYAYRMLDQIEKSKGQFLKDDLEEYHVILDGRRIPIDTEHDAMRIFLDETCDLTRNSKEAVVAIEKLRVEASKRCSKMTFRRFSAMYDGNHPRVYLPVKSDKGEILLVNPKGIILVPNGDNQDQLWLEHPEGNPFEWGGTPSMDEVRAALAEFEKLLVDTQACVVPAMRWFVAMADGLFPLVRDACSTRFIQLNEGDSNSGKSSGGENFVLLHGFPSVLGDASVAALNNSLERGFIVLDNKEHGDFKQSFINYCLFLATPAARERSSNNGTDIRRAAPAPVGIITSIEGVPRAELQNRCVTVEYYLKEGAPRAEREPIKRSIRDSRNRIMSALAVVIQEYLTTRVDPEAREIVAGVNPVQRFVEHFREVCYLLIAFGRVTQGAELGDPWAAKIISEWDAAIRQNRADNAPSSEYEEPIRQNIGMVEHVATKDPYTCEGRVGTLHIVEPAALYSYLQYVKTPDLPTTAAQFSKRLRNDAKLFQRCAMLYDDEKGKRIPELARKGEQRVVGVFIPAKVTPAEPTPPASPPVSA